MTQSGADPGIYFFGEANQVFQSKVEGEARISRPRIEGETRVEGSKRLRIIIIIIIIKYAFQKTVSKASRA